MRAMDQFGRGPPFHAHRASGRMRGVRANADKLPVAHRVQGAAARAAKRAISRYFDCFHLADCLQNHAADPRVAKIILVIQYSELAILEKSIWTSRCGKSVISLLLPRPDKSRRPRFAATFPSRR